MSLLSRVFRSAFLQRCVFAAGSFFFKKPCLFDTENAYANLTNWSRDNGRSCLKSAVLNDAEIDLSIIIPAFNAEKYVEECINSVLNQHTKYSVHIFVVNDGSTDRTSEVLTKYSADNAVTILEKENGGAASARNYALQHISSTYLMFLDADDYLEQDALDRMLDAAFKRNADAVEGGYYTLSGDEKRIGKRYSDAFFDHALGVLSGFTCMKVFRTDFWRNVSFPEGYWFEDSIISMIVLQQMKRVVRIHDMVYTYRANSSGMTSAARQNRKALDSFWIMVQLIKDHAQLELPETNEYWLQILRQIHITYQRTRWMPDYIKKSIFTLSVGIVDQLFPEEILDGGWKFHALLSTLRQKNYRAYCLICEINDSLDE